MPEARVIKKYPNRRLYDTEESRYIKLADVRTLVLNEVSFVVIDKKTGDDITRSILLQVISEGEQQGDAIMSRTFLAHVIRAHGRVPAAAAAAYLEQSLDTFVRRQDGSRGALSDVTPVSHGRWGAAPDQAQRRGAAPSRDTERGNTSVAHDRKKAS